MLHNRLILMSLAMVLPSLRAADLYWDGASGGGWGTASNWATDATGATDPGSAPGSADTAFFNVTSLNGAGNNRTINLGADRSAGGLVFDTASTVLVQAGGTNRNLILGSGGYTRNSGSGAVTVGSTAAGQNVFAQLAASQTWQSLGTGGPLIHVNSVQISTASAAYTLTLDGDSTGSNAIGTSGSGGTIQNGAAGAMLSLHKTGSGSWALAGTGANTYTGSTTVDQGVLLLQKTGGVNAVPGNVTVSGTGVLRLGAANQIPDSAVVDLASSTATFGVNGFNETVSRVIGSGVVNQGTSAATLLILNSATDGSFSGNFTQSGTGVFTIEKQNSNILTWTGTASSFTGELRVNNGGLIFSNSGALGLGTSIRMGNAGTGGGNPTLEYAAPGAVPANLSSRTINAHKNDAITATLLNNSANSAATLTLGTLTSAGTNSAKIYVLGGSNTGDNTVAGVVGGGSGALGGLQLTKADTGTWILGGTSANVAGGTHRIDAGTLVLNKPAGVTAINSSVILLGDGAGTDILRQDAANQIVDTAVITFGQSSAIYRLNGNDETIAALDGASGTVENAGGGTSTLVLNSPAGSANSFGGVLQNGASGTLTFTKTGAGTQILSGANLHSGLNILGNGTANAAPWGSAATGGSGGVVVLGHDSALGSGNLDLRGTQFWSNDNARQIANAILLTSGGGLRFGGQFDLTMDGPITANADRTIANYSDNRTLTLNGNYNSANRLLTIESGATGGTIVMNGGLHGLNRLRLHPNFGQTLELTSSANTFTGTTSIESGILRVTSGNEQSLGLNPGSFRADQLTLSAGTFAVGGANLTLDDSNRGISLSAAGGTFAVDSGRTLSLSTPISGAAGNLTKSGAGTVDITGGNHLVGSFIAADGTFRLSGGTLSAPTGTINPTAIFKLEGGRLRTDTFNVNGGFDWSGGTLTHYSTYQTANMAADHSSSGFQEVGVGHTLTFSGDLASGAGSILALHASPTLYLSSGFLSATGVRFNNFLVNGDLDLSGVGDELALQLNPYLLRPFSTLGEAAEEYGSLPLVVWTGAWDGNTFDLVSGIVDDGRGFELYTEVFSSASALDLNTYFLEYDGPNQTLWFHYKVTGYVPEPDTFALLAFSVLGLRTARVIRDRRARL
jgi:fibronectin-binding autotransporter adhesin